MWKDTLSQSGFGWNRARNWTGILDPLLTLLVPVFSSTISILTANCVRSIIPTLNVVICRVFQYRERNWQAESNERVKTSIKWKECNQSLYFTLKQIACNILWYLNRIHLTLEVFLILPFCNIYFECESILRLNMSYLALRIVYSYGICV